MGRLLGPRERRKQRVRFVDVLREEFRRDRERGVGLRHIALLRKGAGPRLAIEQFAIVAEFNHMAVILALSKEVDVPLVRRRNDVGVLEQFLTGGLPVQRLLRTLQLCLSVQCPNDLACSLHHPPMI